ncbi:MAG: NAD(P)/FAD-dependent oxidoreductase [Alphaproteobacteria bacterium]|jgi:cation diffusion facilitator CzcD-associated flavoprotein CzcO|nr:NAD(P)/FAD-dependent oxidoreductase [Alphaproteobacteria bacterium]
MDVAVEARQGVEQEAGHFDVLIVGAGISGIDAAYHLQQHCPGKSFALLENQESFGGTWLTHKYPGIRSDSDLYTFGYGWKPWCSAPIATAEEILTYLDEVLDEHDIRRHVRYRHEVKSAAWSSDERQWTLAVARLDTGEELRFTCNFLWMCQGYYRHSEGYTPDFPGIERFQGPIVHPQTWPEELDYKDKNVLVIGSGATAATVVPAMADDCAHITMLQRSPTYFYPAANRAEIADMLRELDVPEEWVHEITRRKILSDQKTVIRRSFEDSEALKDELIAGARTYLGDDFDVETHFTPSYRPWRQRLAFLPDGDLFRGIKAGKASVVTDGIETFTEKGVLLRSGTELEADIIVTATGFNLCAMGDIDFAVDGEPVNFADCIGHRGILFTGVPNMAWVFGYLRASWTLRADLVSGFVCRLLNHMAEKGADVVTPQLREEDQDMPALPWVDPENFNAGYLTRNMHLMPKQGDREPWIFSQDYFREKVEIPAADLEDGTLVYR